MESAPQPSSSEASATSQWDSLSDFAGERNINDKTGKERTFTEFDLYPKQPGETNEEYGARLKSMHQKTAEYQEAEAAREAEEKYLASEQGQQELQSKSEYERFAAKIEQAAKEGRITEEHAKVLLERQSAKMNSTIDGARQDYEDRQAVGTPEEQAAYEEWLKNRDAENSENLKKREQGSGEEQQNTDDDDHEGLEDDERKKMEEEERHKLEEEEKRKQLEEQLRKDEEREKELEARLSEIDEELGPLTAINADFTHDKKELAHDIAEQQLNEEQAKANLIKRIWKGNLFRKYYQKKYERQLLSGERTVGVDDNGEDVTLDDIIQDRSGSAIQRFVLGATEDMRYIHRKIGKRNKDGTYDGEKLTEADAETTAAVRGAVEKFASAKIPEGGSIEDLEREFRNDIKRIKAEARDQGREVDATTIDNYLEVAMQARKRVEHGIAMDKVMEGFKVYNADVRNNMRTEAHRDNIDKIVNKVESSKFGSIIPAEVLAMAVSTAWSLAQTGARSAARLAAPIGGIAVSGALAGLRERNRVTEDRTRMIRDAAVGLEYDGTSDEEVKGHRAKKRAKYEAKIGGTVYEMRSATELTDNIAQAMESSDSEAKLRAIAEARVRINYSDSEQKDLISYSSADEMGDERMKLDMAVIRAENSLSEEEKQKLEAMKATVDKKVDEDVDENDKDFRKIRTAQAVKQAGKTVLIGSAVFFASQEIMAAIDPNKVGLFEKAGLLKTQNNEDAQETILAGLAGPRVRTEVHTDTIENISGDRQTEIDAYEQAGYTKTETTPAWTETKRGLVDVDPSKSGHSLKVDLDYANNGTTYSDGNELRLYLENGQYVSGMHGSSTMGNEVFNYEQLAAAGKIKAHINIGGGTFEVASKVTPNGDIAWPIDASGRITSTSGDVIQAFDADGHKLFDTFRVVVDNGTDASGVTHAVSLATDVGENTFNGTIQQIADTVVEHPAIYDFTKTTVTEIPRDVFYGGVVAAPTSRVGLGGPRTASNGGGGEGDGPMVIVDTTGDIPPEIIEGQEAQEIIDNIDNDDNATEAEGASTTGVARSPEPAPTAPGESSQSPNQTSNEKAEFTDRIRKDFGSLVGEEGISFMSSDTNESAENIAQWWNNLNQEAKDAVVNFEKDQQPYGTFLRSWLQLNGHLESEQ